MQRLRGSAQKDRKGKGITSIQRVQIVWSREFKLLLTINCVLPYAPSLIWKTKLFQATLIGILNNIMKKGNIPFPFKRTKQFMYIIISTLSCNIHHHYPPRSSPLFRVLLFSISLPSCTATTLLFGHYSPPQCTHSTVHPLPTLLSPFLPFTLFHCFTLLCLVFSLSSVFLEEHSFAQSSVPPFLPLS